MSPSLRTYVRTMERKATRLEGTPKMATSAYIEREGHTCVCRRLRATVLLLLLLLCGAKAKHIFLVILLSRRRRLFAAGGDVRK